MRVLQRRDLVIGGYTPVGRNFDAILVDYYEGRALMFVGKVRAGFTRRCARRYSPSVPPDFTQQPVPKHPPCLQGHIHRCHHHFALLKRPQRIDRRA